MVYVIVVETVGPVRALLIVYHNKLSKTPFFLLGCVSWFCPCIVYSQNKSRLRHLETRGYPHPSGGDSCTGDCCLHACLLSLGWACLIQVSVSTFKCCIDSWLTTIKSLRLDGRSWQSQKPLPYWRWRVWGLLHSMVLCSLRAHSRKQRTWVGRTKYGRCQSLTITPIIIKIGRSHSDCLARCLHIYIYCFVT